ncbi:unnamed protein product [Effrenium voratum]|nr:unnamed protein product [Effrenium voratum]
MAQMAAATGKFIPGSDSLEAEVAKVRMQTEDGKSQVSEARPHGEEDECADDNYDTLSMTSICSPHLQFVRRDASCSLADTGIELFGCHVGPLESCVFRA